MSRQPFPNLRVRGLRKRFGATTILDGIDLDIGDGERVCVIGPSGSGKSTLLRILMTLEAPDEGVISIGDADLWPGTTPLTPAQELEQRRVRGAIGMVFQHFNLFPHLTARRNITLALRLTRKMPADEADAVADELLERVGLRDRADAFPSRLSGGQRQRIAIARALALQPRIMLFDEVTSALDPELIGEVLAVIRDLAAQRAMTMIFVTHQFGFAREIAHRIVFLDHGRVVEEGAPAQILDRPREERTRLFVGSVMA